MKAADIIAQTARKPFRSFAINLVDGDSVVIDRNDIILHSNRRPELLIVFTEDGRMRLFEESAIASIIQPE